MSISDLYSSGLHKRSLGHFANIVKIALANGFIADSEKDLLDKMAKRLEISSPEYKNILKDPDAYHTNPPVDYDRRIERLFNLTEMVCADGKAGDGQLGLLNKISIGLGFSKEHFKDVTKEAINQFMKGSDIKEFAVAIKEVN